MPRPRGFDEERVVDGAMEVFWAKGYQGTSVSDLTTGLGVHPGSLYRVFGDKHALFLRALTRYREMQVGPLASALVEGGLVLPTIRGVLAGLVEVAAQDAEPRGCLVANTAGELLPGDTEVRQAVSAALADVEDAFLQGLRLAEKQGEIPAGLDLLGWAAALTMLVQGLQVLVKADPDPRRLTRGLDVILELLGEKHG